MGAIYVVDPATNQSIAVKIDGDQPSPTEAQRIRDWQSSRTPPPAPVVAPLEEETGGVMDWFGEIGRGGIEGIASLPRGFASIVSPESMVNPEEGSWGATFRDLSESGERAGRYLFGEPEEGAAYDLARGLGSIAPSFLAAGIAAPFTGGMSVPAAFATTSLAGGAVGAALGADEAVRTLEQRIAAGEDITDEQVNDLVRSFAGIGTLEGVPVGLTLGPISKVLRKVPVSKLPLAKSVIARAVARVTLDASAEGAQELTDTLLKDLAEKNIIDPDLKVGEDALSALAIGSGVGGIVGVVAEVIGRRDRKAPDPRADEKADYDEDVALERPELRERIAAAQQAAGAQLPRADTAAFEVRQQAEAAQRSDLTGLAEQLQKARGVDEDVAELPEALRYKPQPLPQRQAGAPATPVQVPYSQRAAEEEAASMRRGLTALSISKAEEQKELERRLRIAEAGGEVPFGRTATEAAARVERDRLADDTRQAHAQQATTKAVTPKAVTKSDLKRIAKNKAQADYGWDKQVWSYTTPDGKEYVAFKEEQGGSTIPAKSWGVYERDAGVSSAVYAGENLTDVAGFISKEQVQETRPATDPQAEEAGAIAETAEVLADADKFMVPFEDATGAKSQEVMSRQELRGYGWSDEAIGALPRADERKSAVTAQAALPKRQRFAPLPDAQKPESVVALEKSAKKRLEGVGLPEYAKNFQAFRVLQPWKLQGPEAELIEGLETIEDGVFVMKASSEVYGGNLTPEQQLDRGMETVNHEIVHAFRSGGLFSAKEWGILANAAKKTMFVRRDGNKRRYSYYYKSVQEHTDEKGNLTKSEDYIAEEAVANMFRDWAAGRLKIGGQPQTLFRRMMKALKALFGAVQDQVKAQNVESAADIFNLIEGGGIGSRERGSGAARPPAAQPDAGRKSSIKLSREKVGPVAPTPENIAEIERYSAKVMRTQAFRDWATQEDGLTAARNEDGSPAVIYRGVRFNEATPGDLEAMSYFKTRRQYPATFGATNPNTANTYGAIDSDDIYKEMNMVRSGPLATGPVPRYRSMVIPFFARGRIKNITSAVVNADDLRDSRAEGWMPTFNWKAIDRLIKSGNGPGDGEIWVIRRAQDPGASLDDSTPGWEEMYRSAGDDPGDIYVLGPNTDIRPVYSFRDADVTPSDTGTPAERFSSLRQRASMAERALSKADPQRSNIAVEAVRAAHRLLPMISDPDQPVSPERPMTLLRALHGRLVSGDLDNLGGADEYLQDYADLQTKVPVHNAMQWRARAIPLAIAEGNTVAALKHTRDLSRDFQEGGSPADYDGGFAQGERYSSVRLKQPSESVSAHKLPSTLLVEGSGEKARFPLTQAFTASNAEKNIGNIDAVKEAHPQPLQSVESWTAAMQDAFGGDYVPAPPMQALTYSISPARIADKLQQLPNEFKKAVDKGFGYINEIGDIYRSGNADPRMTADLLVWGILSRGKGPVEQESAYIDVIDAAQPTIGKMINEPLTDADIAAWEDVVTAALPAGSPGRKATNNINAAGRLLQSVSQVIPGTKESVIQRLHNMMSDPNVTAAEIRRDFLSNSIGSGIDNKVFSFMLLVGGKPDVLVMDRIQGRHLWDDGRWGGANIYDGLTVANTNGQGLVGIFRGPRALLVTEMLEDALRENVGVAYSLVGRPEDASLGRLHWETWVIDGQQAVSHDTLQGVIARSPVGTSVTEGKLGIYASGMTYMRRENGTVVQYPLSTGDVVYMSPTRFNEFTAEIKKPSAGVVPAKFLVSKSTDRPWYERPDVNRRQLDQKALEYANARPDGSVQEGPAGSGEAYPADGEGRRYSADTQRIETGARPEQRRSRVVLRPDGTVEKPKVVSSPRYSRRRIAETSNPVTDADLYNLNEDFFRRPGWGVVTANRPDNVDDRMSDFPEVAQQYVDQRNDDFRRYLDYMGLPYREVTGFYKGNDEGLSFLIIADEATIMKLGQENYQESVITSGGLIYTNKKAADTPSTGDVFLDDEARAQEGYTEVGNRAFSLGLNWDIGPGIAQFPENFYFHVDRPQLPINRETGLAELHHFSDKKLDSIDPKFAGTGTLKGPEYREGWKASFYGVNPREKYRDPGTGYVKEDDRWAYDHTVEVDPKDLYPWYENPDEIDTGQNEGQYRRNIKEAGYKGYYITDDGSNRAPLGNVAVMFKAMPVKNVKEDVRKSSVRLSQRGGRPPATGAGTRMQSVNADRRQRSFDKHLVEAEGRMVYGRVAKGLERGLGVFSSIIRDPLRREELADDIVMKFQDRFLPVGKMVDELRANGFEVREAIDTYMREINMHGIVGEMVRKRTEELYDPIGAAVGRIELSPQEVASLRAASDAASPKGVGFVSHAIDSFRKAELSLKTRALTRLGLTDPDRLAIADAYLYAKHAPYRNKWVFDNSGEKRLNGSGMTDAEAQAIVSFVERLPAAKRAAFNEVLDLAMKIGDDMNAVSKEAGTIPADMQSPMRFWVPLKGKLDRDGFIEEGYGAPIATPYVGVRGRESQRVAGRQDYAANSMVAELIAQSQKRVLRGEKNKVAQSFMQLLQEFPEELAGWAEITGPPMGEKLTGSDIRKFPGMMTPNDVLTLKVDGEWKYIKLHDHRLMRAFQTNAVPAVPGALTKAMRSFTRYLANVNVTWNPFFVFGNLPRDIETALLNASQYDVDGIWKQLSNPIRMKDAGRAIWLVERKGKDALSFAKNDQQRKFIKRFIEFREAGGMNVTNTMGNIEEIENGLDRALGMISSEGSKDFAKRSTAKMAKGWDATFQWIEDWNTAAENIARLNFFDALMDRDASPARAAQASRDLTTNFAKGGEYKTAINGAYMFYNASLQGTMAMLRALGRSKKARGVFGSLMVLGFMQDQLNAMIGGDDWDDMPEYDLEHNIILMDFAGVLPEGAGIKIPLAYGLNMPWNAGRALSRYIRDGNADKFRSSLYGTTMETVWPLGGDESWFNMISPTFADPVVDLLENENYMEVPIYKEEGTYGDDTPRAYRHFSSTGAGFKWVAESLNDVTFGNEVREGWISANPDVLEYLFDTFTGATGASLARMATTPWAAGDIINGEWDQIRQIPAARRFYARSYEQVDTSRFFDKSREVERARKELITARRAGDKGWEDSVKKNYAEELKVYGAVRAMQNQRRKLSAMINKINANPALTEERKEELIDRLNKKRIELIQRGNDIMRNI